MPLFWDRKRRGVRVGLSMESRDAAVRTSARTLRRVLFYERGLILTRFARLRCDSQRNENSI